MTEHQPVQVEHITAHAEPEPNPSLIERFLQISTDVEKGERPTATVRELLAWFGAERRGYRVVEDVRKSLESFKLATLPPFESQYIDGPLEFISLIEWEAHLKSISIETSEPEFDPTYRVSRLKAANTPPLSVKPDQPLAAAITLMTKHDFSQLPVMTTEREVKGLISWKSVGTRMALNKKCEFVRDCIDRSYEVRRDDHIFKVIALVVENDCVLVRDDSKVVCGLITASDLGLQFQQWAEPFLLVGEIENLLRRRITRCFDVEAMRAAKNPNDETRVVDGVSDLTFGEYVRLLENIERWKRLELQIDREDFISELNAINEIRNSVMHFDPDGIDSGELERLRRFRAFLERLEEISPS